MMCLQEDKLNLLVEMEMPFVLLFMTYCFPAS